MHEFIPDLQFLGNGGHTTQEQHKRHPWAVFRLKLKQARDCLPQQMQLLKVDRRIRF